MSRVYGAIQIQVHPNIKACEHKLYSHCTRVVTIPGKHYVGVFTKTSHEPTPPTSTYRVLIRADCTRAHERGTLETLSYELADVMPIMVCEFLDSRPIRGVKAPWSGRA
jgi:hypothetical protein